MKLVALISLLSSLALSVSASANGALYECDATKLSSENLCYFTGTTITAVPHTYDTSIAAEGFKQVVDSSGNALSVTPKPWTNGDSIAASSTQLPTDDTNYEKVFELVAPIRNYMMYRPDLIKSTSGLWAQLVKPFTDCKIKEQDEVTSTNTAYSLTNTYNVLNDPNGLGNGKANHIILQFLEEGAIDLVCLATSLSMDRCTTIRATMGVTTTSTCWEDAYSKLSTLPQFSLTASSVSATTDDDDDDLSDGAIAGIVVGSIAGVILIGALIAVVLKGGSSAPAAAAPAAAPAAKPATRDTKIDFEDDEYYTDSSSYSS